MSHGGEFVRPAREDDVVTDEHPAVPCLLQLLHVCVDAVVDLAGPWAHSLALYSKAVTVRCEPWKAVIKIYQFHTGYIQSENHVFFGVATLKM